VAGSLGEAQLQLTVDQTAFSTGLSKAAAEASRKGAQIQKALESRQAKVDGNQELVNRLQKEALSADASRKALIAQRIGYLKAENAEQIKGIAILKAKLAENNKLVNSYRQASAEAIKGGSGMLGSLGSLAAGIGAAAVVQQVAAIGQESQRTKIQLEALASSYGEVEQASAAVGRIQKVLGVSAIEARQGYSQLYAALRGTGVSAAQLEVLYVGLNKAARLSGAGTQEAAGALLQLKQGLASGALSGDELRSVLESMPALTQQLATTMGVSVGELKKLGSEGKITSDILYRAAAALAGSQAPAKTTVETLGAAWADLKEKIAEAIGPALLDSMATLGVGVAAFAKYLESAKEPLIQIVTGVFGFVKAVGPMVIGILAVQKAMQAWALASKAVAAAQAFVIALTGPQGVALVAAAAGAAALAYAGLNKAMGAIEGTAKGVRDEAAKARAEFEKLRASTGGLNPNQSKTKADYEAERSKSGITSDNALRRAQATLGLEQQALAVAEAQLQIDEARARAANAQQNANAAPNDGKLKAQAEAAAADLETAMIKGGEAMKAAAQSAADELKQAGDQLRNTLRSNLDLLNKETRQRVLNEARGSLNKSLATGRFDNQAVLAGVKTNQDLLDMASKLEGINSSFDQYSKAQDNVARVQEQLDVSFKDLGVKMEDVAAALVKNTEAERNIKLNVTVNADGTYSISQTEAQAALY
jgi:tape measure domain-containing protein